MWLKGVNRSGTANPFFGKHHSKRTKDKLKTVDRSYTQTQEFKEKCIKCGSSNGMHGKSIYDVWLSKYGKEEADRRHKELCKKRSQNAKGKGKNNPMYNKPSPISIDSVKKLFEDGIIKLTNKTKNKLESRFKSKYLKSDLKLNEETEMTIKDFFKFCKQGGQYQIDTPDGWKNINFLVRKPKKECCKIKAKGFRLTCSNEHLIETSDGWKKSKDIIVGDQIITKKGAKLVTKKESKCSRRTYDLQVNSEQSRYYTNNIISHNCGKSRICEALANEWHLNLIEFDPSRVFSSRVGESEGNMYLALARIESLSPAILFIDEIEKRFAGMQSSTFSDAGTTSRTISIFLVWMENNQSCIFNMSTCNQLNLLPPELISRFDEIFYVGLPDNNERREILDILIRENNRDSTKLDLDRLVAVSQHLSGREIKHAVSEAMYSAFYLNRLDPSVNADLSTDILEDILKRKISVIKVMEKQLSYLIKWVGYDEEKRDGVRARFANNEVDDIDALFMEVLKNSDTSSTNSSDQFPQF